MKAWRKSFREGYLPPVLLLWISGLCRYVILDGHDRLLAALLEDRRPPLLALLALGEWKPRTDVRRREAISSEVAKQLLAANSVRPPRGRPFAVENANRLLIDAFDDRPRLSLTTRAWPVAGGVHSWLDEVRGQLRRVTKDQVHHEMVGDPSAS